MVHLVRMLSRSTEETLGIGHRLAACLSSGDCVALRGTLGSGKSVLARGILTGLGIGQSKPSPTFVIVATYEARCAVNHIDLYRIKSADEAHGLGLEDMLYSDSVNVIEWAEKIEDLLPPSRIDVTLELRREPEERLVTVLPADDATKKRLVPFAEAVLRNA